jgi:SAM-dependent methyltransferase
MLPYIPNEEYTHPELYDLENSDFEPEGLFFLEMAQALGGPVLELGCGTGRMTIPLAERGLELTGVEIEPAMLELARRKAGDLPIRWVQADARSFDLDQKFNFIFESGSVFMHMLTNADQAAFLEQVRRHLAPGGRFTFCIFFPHPAHLHPDGEEKEWFTYQDAQGRTVQVSGTEKYDELRQVMTETAIRRITHSDGSQTTIIAPLDLRYTFPQEMEALLEHAGFRILECYAGPDKSELTPESPLIVYVVGLAE